MIITMSTLTINYVSGVQKQFVLVNDQDVEDVLVVYAEFRKFLRTTDIHHGILQNKLPFMSFFVV